MAMDDIDFSELKEQHRQLRRTIKSIAEFVKEFQQGLHEVEIEVRLDTLDSSMCKFYGMQRRMKVIVDDEDLERKPDTEETEAQRKRRVKTLAARREAEFDEVASEVERLYYPSKAALLNLRPKMREPAEIEKDPRVEDPDVSRVKLPDIQLPSFGGKIREWITFRDMFTSLINNNNQLSPIAKFPYLRSYVTDEAFQEISSIEMNAANYQVVWSAIERRYTLRY
ncbi:uncharacterized protein LOC129742424 [Uranotaenia lowii]|uniref:uncharacterized protein LOC129742424 n=1 Tax=Uranotaenia lowii TaxID=190385 RepID=UPI00247891A9|nr:uncharacterized protein LOC129742424 [Uranotaenia lowii]